jgi:hypothetical protein
MFTKRCLLAMTIAATPIAAMCEPAKVYFGILSGINESPSNASPGTGVALVTYDPDTSMMRVQATFSGLTLDGVGTTASHIHCCVVSSSPNAGVATMTPSFVDFPLGVRSGTYDHTFDMTLAASYSAAFIAAQGGSVGAAQGALLAGLANGTAYFNIHSSIYPGGEIRSTLFPDKIFAANFE